MGVALQPMEPMRLLEHVEPPFDEPSEPSQLSEQIEAEEPVEPVEPLQPAEPVQAEPEPIQAKQPTQPVVSVDPDEPVMKEITAVEQQPAAMPEVEAPPSADPIQPRERPVSERTRLPRKDDAPSEEGSVPDDESLAGMQDRLLNRVELGVTAPILRQQMKLPVAPAYEDDDVVEYYAVKQEQWILARMQVDLQRPSLQNVPSGNIHYNVLIGQVSKQLRQDVPLDVLRPPLDRGEPVEVFSLRGGGSWLPAFIDVEQPGDTNLGYNIRLHPGGQELRRIPSTRLRRRYPSKMVVRVYKGPDLGWARMVVHPLAGKDGSDVRGLRIAEASPHLQSKSTPTEPWALVPVCRE